MEHSKAPGSDPAGLKFCRQVLHPLLGLSAVTCLLAVIGWTGSVTDWQHWTTVITGFVFALERAWVFVAVNPRGQERRRLIYHLAVAAAVFCVSAQLLVLHLSGSGSWSTGLHLFIQISVLVSGFASMIHHQTRFTARAVHPGWMLIGSFFAIVVVGALLLKMPRCVVPGQTCSWLDAAFTSTSAVCVTGLAVENTATFFSHTGQLVILLLIQIGGLGIMTLTFFAAVVLFEGISLHDRLLLGKMIQENRLSRIGRTLTFIVGMTFVCEGIGALVLFAGMDGELALNDRIFHSVFHSVSAFCNAGFSTFIDGLASGVVQENRIWQGCVMVLVVIGGLGSLVVEDLSEWVVAKGRRRLGKVCPAHRLRTHTRLVLVVTATLVVGGAAVIMVTDFLLWHGPENGGKVLTACFHSVTARTAGFNTVPMGGIGLQTIQILMVLMLIGGSPGGTAGGIRTTVIAVGLGHLWNQLRMGRRGMVAFNRTIPAANGTQALGLILLAGIWLTGNFMVFQFIEAGNGISGTRLLFELVSAFATVGLSLDLTPLLTDGGKTLLIVNMFVGRIGLLTVMATLIPPDVRPASGKPTEDILLN
jgi:Trk-type K+ transport system membrane component